MFWYIYLAFVVNFLLVSSKRDVEKGCWPNNVVPYTIEDGFSQNQLQWIKRNIGELHRLTCVRWLNIEELGLNVTDYAVFVKSPKRLCVMIPQTSDKGYVAKIVLGDVCFWDDFKSAVIHEMLQVMGLRNEHQRSNRDCYVKVHRNIVLKTGVKSTYEIAPHEPWAERFPYDKLSVMHYLRDARLKAITERWYEYEPLGNKEGKMSYFDLWKINYRFCNFVHFCDVVPQVCVLLDTVEKDCRKNSSNFGTLEDIYGNNFAH